MAEPTSEGTRPVAAMSTVRCPVSRYCRPRVPPAVVPQIPPDEADAQQETGN